MAKSELVSIDKEDIIAVSVIVPVHNSMEFLPMTVDSLLNQSLENIELIFCENSSTDGSDTYLDELESRHSNVIVRHLPNQTSPSPGRNEGAKIARGEFLYFCDSDDYVYPDALKNMYDGAKLSNADLVIGSIAYTYDDGKTIIKRCPYRNGMSKTQYMKFQFCSVWEKLVRRDLFETLPPFIMTAFEDVIWSYQAISNAKRVIHTRKPIYLWYRRIGSISNTNYSKYAETIADSEDILYQTINPDFMEAVELFMARRARWQMGYRWYISDIVIDAIKRFWTRYKENELIKKDENLYNYLEFYADIPEKKIPHRIIIGGFNNKDCSEMITYFQTHAFRYPCEVYVLSEKNCNFSENRIISEAWEKQNYALVENYFAVKEIFLNGGFYCSSDMKFNAPLNSIDCWESVFSYSSNSKLSSSIYGGQAHSQHFEAILESFTKLDNEIELEINSEVQEIIEEPEEAVPSKKVYPVEDIQDDPRYHDAYSVASDEDNTEERKKVPYMGLDFDISSRFEQALFESFMLNADGKTERHNGYLLLCAADVLLYNLYPSELSNDPQMQISYCSNAIKKSEDGSVYLSKEAMDFYISRERIIREKNSTMKNHLIELRKHHSHLKWLVNKRSWLRRVLKKTPVYFLYKAFKKFRNRSL